MQLDPVGASAIQTMGQDIGNLMVRISIMTACLDQIIAQNKALDRGSWRMEPVPNDDGSPSNAYVATLPGTEMDKLQRLLADILSLE